MIRILIMLFWVFVVYTLLKTLFRAVVKSEPQKTREQDRIRGEEMVQDPQCRTYVPRARAVTRQVNGKLCSFCSETCANQYEEQHRT
jgi:uncharacterized protein